MKNLRKMFWIVSMLGLLAAPHDVWAADVAAVNRWHGIHYPAVTAETGEPLRISLSPDARGLRITILVSGGPETPSFFSNKTVSAKLHRPDGTVVVPTEDMLNIGLGLGHSYSPTWNGMAFFPWSTNALEEGWMELKIARERYWLEIPYGFTSDPRQSLSSGNSNGLPQAVPAMKEPGSRDHVLRWNYVDYDVGAIQNDWRLSLRQSNPFDGITELVLYRDRDNGLGWDLHNPRTTVRVRNAKGQVASGFPTAIRNHEDGMRRTDTFRAGHGGGPAREWGEIQIAVEDKTYRVTVPSSLYRKRHGHSGLEEQR